MLRATLVESEIRRVIGVPGNGDLVVNGVVDLEAAESGFLCFVNRDLPAETRRALATLQGCIVIVRAGSSLDGALGACRVLEVPDPRAAIAKVLDFIRAERRLQPWLTTRRIAASATISPFAVLEGIVDIGEDVVIEAFCTIGPDVAIGRNTLVRAGARIAGRVSIGEASVIGLNAVIGAEGFGFVRDDNGNKVRVPHLGGIVIGSHVEIDALAAVQYGTIAPTIIEDYAKIGIQVGVGHNARIGRGVSLTAGISVGGSATIEEEVWVGMNAVVRNGRRVGARSLVGMNASVQHDVGERMVAIARPAHLGKRSAEDDDRAIGFTDRSIEPAPRRPPADD